MVAARDSHTGPRAGEAHAERSESDAAGPNERVRLRELLRRIRDALGRGLIERDAPARLALLAAVAGEHLLLIGPPGSAKSELARRLRGAFVDGAYFERLLTKFSVPEELFGPLSISSLERDEYKRLTSGYLPSARIAFLDEIFKANSAILNALLTLLNEREFDNGPTREASPLACVVAASNELPDGDELAALEDRFLIRCEVSPISSAAFDRLLDLDEWPASDAVHPGDRLDPRALEAIRIAARSVRLSHTARGYLNALRAHLTDRKVYVSDRRWRRIASLLRVAAYTDGRDDVSLTDCWLVQHCAWRRPAERTLVEDFFRTRLDSALVDEPARYETLVATLEKTHQEEANACSQRVDARGNLLYRDANGAPTPAPKRRRQMTTSDGDVLYLRPAGSAHYEPGASSRAYTIEQLHRNFFENDIAALERYVSNPERIAYEEFAHEPILDATRYPQSHVDARTRQIDEIDRDLRAFANGVESTRSSNRADEWLWIAREVVDGWKGRLDATHETVARLAPRIAKLREAISSLPVRALR